MAIVPIIWSCALPVTVPSPKTEHQHKPYRVVPIFPELRPYLEDAHALAAKKAVYLIQGYRDDTQNLRTQFERIIRRARVKPWERLFHNLRASRQTELADQFPLHVVTDWIGNSPDIAERHYLKTTEEHFRRALGGAEQTTRNPTQQAAVSDQIESQTQKASSSEDEALLALARLCVQDAFEGYPHGESNYLEIPEENAPFPKSGADSGADLQLAELIGLWPRLAADCRQRVLELARANLA
ncbi:MAG TPA: hypothetical protein VHD36_12100 [Pirellulales bacterium]|nr:hypothetical protein [Pirellulales bacterium]